MSGDGLTRRRLLTGAPVPALAALASLAVACRGRAKPAGAAQVDLDTAAHAAGMERVVVDTYKSITDRAVGGGLGAALPPVVFEYVALATGQHQQHMDAWNRFLAGAGHPAVTAPTAALRQAVDGVLGRAADVPAVATLALRLEDYASQTYLKALPTLTHPDAIRTAAQILVVDEEHQALLRYVLGLSPVGSGATRDFKDVAPADPALGLLSG